MAHAKPQCVACRKRPALFQVRGGRVQTDPTGQHNLCKQCFRDQQNRLRAQELKRG